MSAAKTRFLPVILDLVVVVLAWFGAYWLRFNLGTIPESFWQRAVEAVWVVLLVQTVVYVVFKVYRGIWRYVSMTDTSRILAAAVVGDIAILVALFLLFRLEDVPRSLPLLYLMLLLSGWVGPRLLYRRLKSKAAGIFAGGKRVLIVGAGQAGEYLVRDMLRGRNGQYQPIAFVDDKTRRLGQDVHGVPVVGTCDQIPRFVSELDADLIVLAVPSASSAEMRRLTTFCEESGVPFRTLPPLYDIVSGAAKLEELREVSLDDLLGRDPVDLDWDGIRQGLGGKRLLVTGAGGSIGSELCRQLLQLEPSLLVLVDNGEFNLYSIDRELRSTECRDIIRTCLCDISHDSSIDHIMTIHNPDVVFHAAAYKHVPLLEHQVREAVKNNVLGTRNVAQAAVACGCNEFVLVSTDKAVNPSNVMGATKRLAEIYCQNLNDQTTTRFFTVRFGNVLGSAGSVIPLFRSQIANGGPVTVTDPEIERFFMTIREASQLIMQSAVIGNGGEIFVLDMGVPVKIKGLAEHMIRMSGKHVGDDIAIVYTGMRPGEKLYEELFHEKEAMQPTTHTKIFLARSRPADWDVLKRAFSRIDAACESVDEEALRSELAMLVPEYAAAIPR